MESNLVISEVESLKSKLEEKERHLLLAAQYGKDLLDQNAELHTRMETLIIDSDKNIEKLRQENYSLSMKLEARERVVCSLSSEIEIQEKIHKEKLEKTTQQLEAQLAKLNQKISKNEFVIDSLEKESAIYKEKSDNFQVILEQNQNQKHETSYVSGHDGLGEHVAELEAQINQLNHEKQTLEKELCELKASLKSANLKIKTTQLDLETAEKELEDKECQLTATFNEVERMKVQNEELQMEMDQMKFAETDPTKKGNSLFAELEDNRQALEKRLMTVLSKHSTLKKQCQIKTQQVAKLKLHIASLLNMTTNQADQKYQHYLEDSLTSIKSQLQEMSLKYKALSDELQQKQRMQIKSDKEECNSKAKSDNFLKHLNKELLTKMSGLEEEEVRSLRFSRVCLDDQNLQLRRKLRQSEIERDANKAEMIRLSVTIEELKNIKDLPADSAELRKDDAKDVFVEELPMSGCDKETEWHDKTPFSENCFKEEFIQIKKESPQKEIIINASNCDSTGKENKENEPSVNSSIENRKGNRPKKVGFNVEKSDKESSTAEMLKALPKVRKKMEAPHIKVEQTQDSDQTECKVQ